MQRPHAPETTIQRQPVYATRLQGGGLRVARFVWLVLTVLALGLFVAGTAVSAGEELPRCRAAAGACDPVELAVEDIAVMHAAGVPAGAVSTLLAVLDSALNLTFLAVGILIFWRSAGDGMALLLSLTLVLLGMVVFTSSGNALVRTYPALAPAVTVLGGIAIAALVVTLFVFPDGRFVPRWTRLAVLPSVIMLVDMYQGQGRLPTMITVPGLTIAAASALGAGLYRYRRVSSAEQRQQTKWVAFGLLGAIGVVGTWLAMALAFPPEVPGTARTVALLVSRVLLLAFGMTLPLAVAFAILRYRLYDIDILINRTVVYGILSTSIVGLYVLVVGTLSALFQASGNPTIAILASGLAACLVQPLRARLQRSVNRLMYGQRDDPYTVLSLLSQQIRSTLAPAAMLPTIVDGVARALKLPYVAVELRNGQLLEVEAAYGQPTGTIVTLPLIYQSDMVGQLLVAQRAPDEPFTPAERRLLDDIALQAGVTAYAVQVTHALQHSRERLVTAREDERRRLRRDLHDGLGPTLASLSMQLDAAEALAHDQPAAGLSLLNVIRHELQGTIGTVRRLVYALRPPVLDQFGLVAALREHAEHWTDDTVRIDVTVAPDHLALPAAIEVAAYYIGVEAMTNVARHARARHCQVALTLTDTGLTVVVADDGRGLPATFNAGVGMASMRERAEELGGSLRITAAGGGTRVEAWLPLR